LNTSRQASWLDEHGHFFNPKPRVHVADIGLGHRCVVVDDALANPEGLRAWAAAQGFVPPLGYPYPGHVADVPPETTARLLDCFSQHARARLGVRRALDAVLRLSLIDTPVAELAPVQWQCHRDRLPEQGSELLFAASVLYLFHDPALGGTSFYAPRQSIAATEQLVADSQHLAPNEFSARYGLQPAYMAGSNAYFEQTAQVTAAWNRLIFYDGSQFHSADVNPERLIADPMQGRLTLNSFITCRRSSS
jgi:hypothetical protein